MALIQINRRCDDCEKTRALLKEAMREVESIRLDYHSLYEKVRINLSKLAKRAEREEPESAPNGDDQLARARALLLERKLKRSQI